MWKMYVVRSGEGGNKGVVKITNCLKIKTEKLINLKKNLSCKNFRIYVAECMESYEYYVGETII